jgi:hypothetical protein
LQCDKSLLSLTLISYFIIFFFVRLQKGIMSITVSSTDGSVVLYSGSLETFFKLRTFIANRLAVPHYDVTVDLWGDNVDNMEIICNNVLRNTELEKLAVENEAAFTFLKPTEDKIEMDCRQCHLLAGILSPIRDDQWNEVMDQFIGGLHECANHDLSIRSDVECT